MLSSQVTAGANIRASDHNNIYKDIVLGNLVFGTDTDGATVTFDLSDVTKGKVRSVTLGGNRTLAVSNVTANSAFLIILKQDATGSRTVTWWSGIKWPNATAPVLTTTANRYDIFQFLYDGTNYYGTVVGQNLG